MSRATLSELRQLVLYELDDGWLTATEVCRRHGLGNSRSWDRVALILERLAHEGVAELRNPRSRGHRHFRRVA
jgi:hypothetical protein